MKHYVEKTMKVYVEVEAKTAADAKRIVDECELKVVSNGYVQSTFDENGNKERELISCRFTETKPRWMATLCPRCGNKKFNIKQPQCGICNARDMGHHGGWD